MSGWFLWIWEWVHLTQIASELIRSQSNRPPLWWKIPIMDVQPKIWRNCVTPSCQYGEKYKKNKHNPPRLHKYLGKCVKPTDVLTVLRGTSEVAYNRQMVHDDHLTTWSTVCYLAREVHKRYIIEDLKDCKTTKTSYIDISLIVLHVMSQNKTKIKRI